jgi:hypothetical protein
MLVLIKYFELKDITILVIDINWMAEYKTMKAFFYETDIINS